VVPAGAAVQAVGRGLLAVQQAVPGRRAGLPHVPLPRLVVAAERRLVTWQVSGAGVLTLLVVVALALAVR
jgi:hypothetical protein